MPRASYSDGVVSIRRLDPLDIEGDLAAKDEEQITWLWEPWQREAWEAMSDGEQRAHALRTLQAAKASFGRGPKWCFAVDTVSDSYVAYVDCDLANPHVPHGQANISYSAHPAHRGRGYVSRAVRLLLGFVHENTSANEAHVIVDQENVASTRVAMAVGGVPTEIWRNEHGRMMVRHVVRLDPRT